MEARNPSRLLVVSGDPAACEVIETALAGEGHTVVTAQTGRDAVQEAHAHPPDVVILDVDPGGTDWHAIPDALRAEPGMGDVPFVFALAGTHLETLLRALPEGVNDYIPKPIRREELLVRVRVALRLKALQDALRRQDAQLEELAILDELTGLYNRRYVLQRLGEEVLRARRYRLPLSCLMLDLDHFKRVNDTHGHLAGDAVLRQLGATLRLSVRSTDVVGRYGGEEFLVLLPQTPLSGARTLAERIRWVVEQTVFDAGGVRVRCTVSIGVATAPQGEPPDLDRLVGAADEALYLAKRRGRNRVEVAPLQAAG